MLLIICDNPIKDLKLALLAILIRGVEWVLQLGNYSQGLTFMAATASFEKYSGAREKLLETQARPGAISQNYEFLQIRSHFDSHLGNLRNLRNSEILKAGECARKRLSALKFKEQWAIRIWKEVVSTAATGHWLLLIPELLLCCVRFVAHHNVHWVKRRRSINCGRYSFRRDS